MLRTRTNNKVSQTLFLDTAANPSFVRKCDANRTDPTIPQTVHTPNGTFQSTETTKVAVKTSKGTMMVEALVHDGLSENLLSTTPIVNNMGEIIFDKTGAAVLTEETNNTIRPQIKYFAHRNKDLYTGDTTNGTICLNSSTKPRSEKPASEPDKTGKATQPTKATKEKR